MAFSWSHPRLWSEPKLQVGPVAITGVCPQDSVSEKAEPVAPLQKDPPSTGGPLGSLSRVRLLCFQPPLLPPHQIPSASSVKWSLESSQPAAGMPVLEGIDLEQREAPLHVWWYLGCCIMADPEVIPQSHATLVTADCAVVILC